MRLLAHEREVPGVVVVPQSRQGSRRAVRFRMDRAELRADGGPAALGLDGAETRLCTRPVGAEARAVRYLVEAVAQHLGPDADRLEQDVVTRVTRHAGPSCVRGQELGDRGEELLRVGVLRGGEQLVGLAFLADLAL